MHPTTWKLRRYYAIWPRRTKGPGGIQKANSLNLEQGDYAALHRYSNQYFTRGLKLGDWGKLIQAKVHVKKIQLDTVSTEDEESDANQGMWAHSKLEKPSKYAGVSSERNAPVLRLSQKC